MNERETVLAIMEKKGVTMAEIGRLLGKSKNNIWNILKLDNHKGMSVGTLKDMLNVLDCDLVIKPRNGEKGIVL